MLGVDLTNRVLRILSQARLRGLGRAEVETWKTSQEKSNHGMRANGVAIDVDGSPDARRSRVSHSAQN